MEERYFTPKELEIFDEHIKKFIKEEEIRNMTNKVASEEIEKHNNNLKDTIIFSHSFWPKHDEKNYLLRRQVKANELAIQALNKETPQKVVADYDYLGFEKCPRCKYGNLLDSNHTQFEYCPMCGQKLEWD